MSLNSMGDVGGHNLLMAAVPKDRRQPLRDPAEDEHVRDMIQAEEKERRKQAATDGQGLGQGPEGREL